MAPLNPELNVTIDLNEGESEKEQYDFEELKNDDFEELEDDFEEQKTESEEHTNDNSTDLKSGASIRGRDSFGNFDLLGTSKPKTKKPHGKKTVTKKKSHGKKQYGTVDPNKAKNWKANCKKDSNWCAKYLASLMSNNKIALPTLSPKEIQAINTECKKQKKKKPSQCYLERSGKKKLDKQNQLLDMIRKSDGSLKVEAYLAIVSCIVLLILTVMLIYCCCCTGSGGSKGGGKGSVKKSTRGKSSKKSFKGGSKKSGKKSGSKKSKKHSA